MEEFNLNNCNSLLFLEISNTDHPFQFKMNNCSHWESLSFSSSFAISDDFIKVIAMGTTNLKSFTVKNCKNVTDESTKDITSSAKNSLKVMIDIQ